MKKGVFAGVMMMFLLFTLAIGLTEAQALPDLKVVSLTVQAYTAAGSKIFITDVTKNIGSDMPLGSASFTCYFLSTTPKIGGAVAKLGRRYVPRLLAGEKNTGSKYVTIPTDVSDGDYYIVAYADFASEFNTLARRKLGYVVESNETNNQLAKPIHVYSTAQKPDLSVSSLTVPASANPGEEISIDDTTTNSGGVAPQTATLFYLSPDSTLDAGDVPLGSRTVSILSGGASSSGTTKVIIPAETAPSVDPYYIFAVADGLNNVSESDENNNSTSQQILITAP